MLRHEYFVITDVEKEGTKVELPVAVWSKAKIKNPASETVACALLAKGKVSTARGQLTKAKNAKGNLAVLTSASNSANRLAKDAEDAAAKAELEQKAENDFDAKAAADAKNFAAEVAKIAAEIAAMLAEATKPEVEEDPAVDANASENTETTPEPNTLEGLLRCFVLVDGEWWVDIGDKLITLGSLSRQNNKAIVGEPPLDRRSPADFKKLAANVSAEIPTEEDFKKLEEVVENLVKMLNELFTNKVDLENQLVVTVDGKYKTYLGEYKYLLENFPVFNLHSRIIKRK